MKYFAASLTGILASSNTHAFTINHAFKVSNVLLLLLYCYCCIVTVTGGSFDALLSKQYCNICTVIESINQSINQSIHVHVALIVD